MENAVRRRPIQPLSPHLANQIAAGEVIERPASVVKELLENSIDAGAATIEVDVEQGGSALIRVRDDGFGIPREELELALAPHATSKVYDAEELAHIDSLGFRGEALASIASVSRLNLVSRADGQERAWRIGYDRDGQCTPAAHPTGTTVEVRELFFNTPARRKFLRTERTEFLHIEEVVKRLALSHFGIGFSLRHNGRQAFAVRPAADTGERARRIATLLGRPFQASSLAVEFAAANMQLHGWLAPPEQSRSQADIQYFYLNGRMIRDRLVTHALRAALGERIETGRYPAYLLYLEMDPGAVDVNVHPTKHEVRFRESRMVHDFLYRAVSQSLEQASEAAVTPVVGTAGYGGLQTQPPLPQQVAEQRSGYQKLYSFTPQVDDSVKSGAEEQLGQALAMVYGRYILARSSDGLVLIDANRAQCRVVFQRLRQVLDEGALRGRPLLIPATLTVTGQQCETVAHYESALGRLGFQIDVLGEETVVVRQVPTVLESADIAALSLAVIDRLHRSKGQIDEVLLLCMAEQAPVPSATGMGTKSLDDLLRRVEATEGAPFPAQLKQVWRHIDEQILEQLLRDIQR